MRGLPVVVTVAATLAAPAIGAAPPTPTVRVVERSPLVIEGRGFAPSRLVTLIARAPGVVEQRTLRASGLGRFRVVIARLSLTGPRRCAAGVVIAVRTGDRGLVLWHPHGLPNCPEPLRPPSVPA